MRLLFVLMRPVVLLGDDALALAAKKAKEEIKLVRTLLCEGLLVLALATLGSGTC